MSVLCLLLFFFFCLFHYDEIFSNKQDCVVQTKRRKKERTKEFGINSLAAWLPALLLSLLSPLVSHSPSAKCTEKLSKKLGKKIKIWGYKNENLRYYLSCSSTIRLSNICIIYVVQLKQNKKLLSYNISEGLEMQLPINSIQITKLNSYITQENN